MLNSAVTHFFCADEIQFESLDVDVAEKKISMMNSCNKLLDMLCEKSNKKILDFTA